MSFIPARIPAQAMTLDAHWYVSDEVFARERERLFANHWLCVGREEQLPSTGDYFVADVTGESIILTRDGSGAIRGFFNVCRHRGTRICSSQQGSFRGSIQCPYHAWTYNLSGELSVARNMEKEDGFDRADYPLHRVAVALYEGFIFINLDTEPQPFEDAFAPLIDRFTRWEIAGLRSGHRMTYDLNCNWKLVFLNYSECYHCPLVHPQLERLSASDSGRNDLHEGPFLGGYSELRTANGSLTTTGRRARSPIGHVEGDDLHRVYYYTLFPSMLLSLHADYVMVHYVMPVTHNKTTVVCEWLFDAAEVARPDFDPMDAAAFWDLTNRQDWQVSELTQLGMSSRAYSRGPYAGQEGLLHAFDRHYLKLMEA